MNTHIHTVYKETRNKLNVMLIMSMQGEVRRPQALTITKVSAA